MGKKKRAKSKVFTYLVLIVCAAIWILPLVIALTKSFTINGFGCDLTEYLTKRTF